MGSNIEKNIKYDYTIWNSDGNPKRLITEFYYDKITLNNYRYDGKGHELRVFVSYDYGLEWHKYISTIKCKSPELLCNMLTLRGKLSDDLFTKFSDLDLSKNDLNLIINWCKKNGFPFQADFRKKPKTKLQKQLYLQPAIYFMVRDFINDLNEIYNAYLLYRIITGQKNIGFKNKYENKNMDECKTLFEDMHKKRELTDQISDEDGTHWDKKAKNLFDAAFYQLALLLNYPKIGNAIGLCPLCKEFFEKSHSKQKYCKSGTCYPQLAYKRKQSKEKNR